MANEKKLMDSPMCVKEYEGLWEVVEALQTIYTISLRDICQALQAHRPWVRRFVQPHVHYIYLSALWTRIARLEATDLVHCNRDEFVELIRNSMECSRQTINIPELLMVAPRHRRAYLKENARWQTYIEELEYAVAKRKIGAFSELVEAREAKERAYLEALDEEAREAIETVDIRHRSLIAPTPVPMPADFDPCLAGGSKNFSTAAAMKTWGDTDELIYRALYDQGRIRMALRLPDADGCISEKVYYFLNPAEHTVLNAWGEELAKGNLEEGILDWRPVPFGFFVAKLPEYWTRCAEEWSR